MDSHTKGTLLMVLSATAFGTIGVLGKLAAQVGMTIPSMLTWRFLFGSLILWAVLAARGDLELLRGRDLLAAVAIGGGWYAVASGFYFWGLEFMTAGLVGIVLYTYPAFVLLLSFLFLEEAITTRTVVALALAFAGVGLVTGVRPAGASVVGVVVVLGSALAYAAYYVTGHVALADVESATLTAHVVPSAAASFLLFGLATGRLAVPATTYEWSLVAAFATVGCAIPLAAFFAGLSYVGASRASIISSLEPATAVLLGALVLGEPVTVPTLVGGGLILAGVVLLQLGERSLLEPERGPADRFFHPWCVYGTMTWDASVLSALRRADVETVAYLPDGAVAPLVERIEAADDLTAVRVTREEQAVGVLSGAWLGGRRGALVCQSSGLANTLNAVGSLNLPARIPFLGLVTRRGDLGEFNLAQVPFGYNGPRILDELGVRNRSVEADDDVERTVTSAARSAYSTAEPYVLWLESSLTGAKDEF